MTSLTTTSRRLGRQETAWTISGENWPMNMVAVVHLTPAPDQDLLRTALDRVQHRHPLLRARIHKRHRRYEFRINGVAAIPLRVIDGAASDAWIGAAEDGLNTDLPTASGPLVAATLVRGDGTGDLVVSIHHAIVDATGFFTMVDEVLATYGELAAGEPAPDLPALPMPPVADDRFPPGYRGMRLRRRGAAFAFRTVVPELRYRRAMRRVGGPRVHRGARSQVLSTDLGGDLTATLSRAARRRRITMHSLLQAAALSTLHRLRYDARPAVMRTMSFPELRAYLDPPVGKEPFACYLTAIFQDVPMDGERDLWAVAADVQQRVDASVRGGARFEAATMIIPSIRMLMATKKLRMANTAVSHTGVTRLADHYGPLEITGLSAFVSHMAVGPELSLRTGMLHGRLTIDLQTLDTDMDRGEMERIAAGVAAALEGAAGS